MSTAHDLVLYVINEAEKSFKEEIYAKDAVCKDYFDNVCEGFQRVRNMYRTIQMNMTASIHEDSSFHEAELICCDENTSTEPVDASENEYSKLRAENSMLKELIVRMVSAEYGLSRKD